MTHRMSGLRILIIEPDQSFREQIQESMRAQGHAVTASQSIREAPQLEETSVDVIIGEISVISYARIQRLKGCRVGKVIVVTTNRYGAIARNYDGTAFAIIPKPSTPREIKALIQKRQAQL